VRRLPDLSLYLVLDPGLCGDEPGMLRTACEAARCGVGCIQLRAPGWSTGRLVALGRDLKKVLRPFGATLIVDNDIVAALLCGADGLHLGQSDANPRLARSLLGEQCLIGLSISNERELANLDSAFVDYAGVGPVMATSTKTDAAPPMGLLAFERIALACPVPCVAIGGIGADTATECAQRGAAGIAVVSAICGKPDIGHEVRRLKTLFLQGKAAP